MKTRRLPGTELDLSVVGFGCWALGKQYWGDDVDDATSANAINTALDEGINWFDTAPLYGEGHADKILVDTEWDKDSITYELYSVNGYAMAA